MILMHADYLLFKVSGGETIPCSAEVATVELLGDAVEQCDPEVVRGAASAVLHYFREELGRDCVSVAEFAEALVRVLRGFGLQVGLAAPEESGLAHARVLEADLRRLACACEKGFELAFFPRLRGELRALLEHSPALLRFTGLRGCVKLLLGARRWTPRCQELNDRIVDFLRGALAVEPQSHACSMIVK